MTMEFESSLCPKLIENLYSPMRQDESQRISFIESEMAFSQVAKKINSIWNVYLEAGIVNHVLIAELLNKPEGLEIVADDISKNYWVEYLGQKVDGLGQEVDVVRMVRVDEKEIESAAFITFATKIDKLKDLKS